MVFQCSFNLYFFYYKRGWASFHLFKCHWYLFLCKLFSYCCWSFSPLFLRALYILFVIWVANIFFSWSYMFSFTDGGVFCPLKIFLILCNHFYLFVYSLCIWVRVRKTLPFSSSLWYFCDCVFPFISLFVWCWYRVCSEIWCQPYSFPIYNCPNTIYLKVYIFSTVS